MEQIDAKKEYYEFIKKYYTENGSFIDKAVFTFSAGAMTFLLGFMQNIEESCFIAYSIGIALFIFTLILQLVSAWIAQRGCDIGYDENKLQQAFKLFDKARLLNNVFLLIFCMAIILTSSSIATNFYKKHKTQNYSVEYNITTPQYNYKERKEYMINKKVNNSLTPPKTVEVFAQDGQVIPKSIQEALVMPQTIQNQVSSQQNNTVQQQAVQQQQDKK